MTLSQIALYDICAKRYCSARGSPQKPQKKRTLERLYFSLGWSAIVGWLLATSLGIAVWFKEPLSKDLPGDDMGLLISYWVQIVISALPIVLV